jgi:hypothetical protein
MIGTKMLFATSAPVPWWMWCKWAGWLILAVALVSNEPVMWAIAAHWLCDFTLQGHQTSIGKSRKSLFVIGYHAFISGGFAGFIAGGLTGLFISVVIHFIVDRLYKPVLGDTVTTRIVDQMVHIITVIMIAMFVGGSI